jgi:tetratricopeptide (TPR) repeat protein
MASLLRNRMPISRVNQRMLRNLFSTLCLISLGGTTFATAAEQTADKLVQAALQAEASLDPRRALELFQAAEKAGRSDAYVLQKIARQYSDLMTELPTRNEKRAFAERALEYSERAVALEPRNAVNVLSVAISLGKLALVSDTRDKVRYSRRVREEAERALALDPDYPWAHHILGRWHHEVATLGRASRAIVHVFYGGLPMASAAEGVRHLQRATELEPDELQHHLELGFAYLAVDDPDRARDAFARGLAMPSRATHDDPAKDRARTAIARLGL